MGERTYPMMPTLLALAASSVGAPLFMLEDERDSIRALDRLQDRLDVLSLIGDGRPKPLPRYLPRKDAVVHIDTPKPLSKRRARRLRGRSA